VLLILLQKVQDQLYVQDVQVDHQQVVKQVLVDVENVLLVNFLRVVIRNVLHVVLDDIVLVVQLNV
jgi:hypothetical protein